MIFIFTSILWAEEVSFGMYGLAENRESVDRKFKDAIFGSEYSATGDSGITIDDLISISNFGDEEAGGFIIKLTKIGGMKNELFTQSRIGKRMLLVVDNKALAWPIVKDVTKDEIQVNGKVLKTEMRLILAMVRAEIIKRDQHAK